MEIKVTKASGITEDLKTEKLLASLLRSGAEKARAEEIIEKILSEIGSHTTTRKIYRLAKKYLRQLNHASSLRYSLKKALSRLGPSGYPFEKYYGAILKNYGYKVSTGIILDGKCVKHEVDVFAVNDKEVLIIECKYRNNTSNAPDVKTAMYVNSRFQDLKPVIRSQYPGKTFRPSLVTNTRFTSEAIKFARCSGFHLKSWRFPENDSLEKMIESRRLYPVTIISGIKSGLIKKIIEHDIILLKDLAEMPLKDIEKILSLTDKKAFALKKQADELCSC